MKKILIIDDYREIRDLYKEVLEKAGFSVDVEEDSGEVVNRLHSVKYDLILLDLLMPKQDGIQTLRMIQDYLNTHAVKIVVMGIADKEGHYKVLVNEAQKLGAVGFLDKRISIEDELLSKVRKIFN